MSAWRYSPHALEQMDRREATYEEVEEALRSPFAIRPAAGRRAHCFRSIGGYSIRVTVVPRIKLIVTVWKESLP